MNATIDIGIINFGIFLGVIQGILLSILFLRKLNSKNSSNLFQGLLILFLALTIFEEWLNNTGYIVQVLFLSDFSEPLNFTFTPLIFLHIKHCLNETKKGREWIHFIPALLWLGYMLFYFIQPNEIKYNSYISTKHPDWEYLDVVMKIKDDPLGIRKHINQLTLVHFVIYLTFSFRVLFRKTRILNQSFLNIKNNVLRILRNTLLHYLIIVLIFLTTKLFFGMDSDIGGYFIAIYISFMFMITSYQIMNASDYFNYPSSFMELPLVKYKKSSLLESDKDRIQNKIKQKMEVELYFKNNLISLSKLSNLIKENKHHLSQVINERFEKTFFELVAFYRIEEAKKLLLADTDKKITIEELAEEVGYNSKSSFNSTFKKHTGKTPSKFRSQ